MVESGVQQQTGKNLLLPVIAYVAIFDRYNEPVLVRNYLA